MKKVFIIIVGGTLLTLGIALLVLPGPGLPILATGIAVLATEFLWARRAMRKMKGVVANVRRKSGLRAWLRRKRGGYGVSPESRL